MRYDCACRNYAARSYTNSLQNSHAEADPNVILYDNWSGKDARKIVFRCGMAFLDNILEMLMSLSSICGMSRSVMNVDVVSNQHAITDRDRFHRPYFATNAHITPIPNSDLTAMTICLKSAPYERMIPYCNTLRTAAEISDLSLFAEL